MIAVLALLVLAVVWAYVRQLDELERLDELAEAHAQRERALRAALETALEEQDLLRAEYEHERTKGRGQ